MPWSRPMAAQHLAATKLQGAIRRFLYKKRMQIIRKAKAEGQKPPWYILAPKNVIKFKQGHTDFNNVKLKNSQIPQNA